MAKRNAQKKGGVMAKEWWKSRSNEQTIEPPVGANNQFEFEIVQSVLLNCWKWLAAEIGWLGCLVQPQLQPANSGQPNRLNTCNHYKRSLFKHK